MYQFSLDFSYVLHCEKGILRNSLLLTWVAEMTDPGGTSVSAVPGGISRREKWGWRVGGVTA